jgi:hypothetical protein
VTSGGILSVAIAEAARKIRTGRAATRGIDLTRIR